MNMFFSAQADVPYVLVHGGFDTLNDCAMSTWCRCIMEAVFMPHPPRDNPTIVVERIADKLHYSHESQTFVVSLNSSAIVRFPQWIDSESTVLVRFEYKQRNLKIQAVFVDPLTKTLKKNATILDLFFIMRKLEERAIVDWHKSNRKKKK